MAIIFSALLLIGVFFTSEATAYGANPPDHIWWERLVDHQHFRAVKSRSERVAALERPKRLALRGGVFPHDDGSLPIAKAIDAGHLRVLVRNPEGAVSTVDVDADNPVVTLPTDLRGLYLICAHLKDRQVDVDKDGNYEPVQFYAKTLVYHFKRDGRIDPEPQVFFKDLTDAFPLEIGPVITEKRTGGGPFMGGYQTALKAHRMKILFRGQPLENAQLTVKTTSGWEKRFCSDAQGLVVLNPPETLAKPPNQKAKAQTISPKNTSPGKATPPPGPQPAGGMPSNKASLPTRAPRDDKYLYTVTHQDPETGGYYVSSLIMTVNRSQPEWLSSSRAFAIWAMVGIGVGMIAAVGGVYHQKKRKQATVLALFK